MKGDTQHIVIKMDKMTLKEKDSKVTPVTTPYPGWIQLAKDNKLDAIEAQDPDVFAQYYQSWQQICTDNMQVKLRQNGLRQNTQWIYCVNISVNDAVEQILNNYQGQTYHKSGTDCRWDGYQKQPVAILSGTNKADVSLDWLDGLVEWTDVKYDYKGLTASGMVQLVYDKLFIVSIYEPREIMSDEYWKIVENQIDLQTV